MECEHSHNKFYTASLIRDGCNYIVHRRFGRVGVKAPQVGLCYEFMRITGGCSAFC